MQGNLPDRRGIAPEVAARYLSDGKLTAQGKTVYVFTDTLSDLPSMKNEQLAGRDFVIHKLAGEVSTEYGEAWIFEIGTNLDRATASWLVGKPVGNRNDSVIGKNIKRHFDRNGGSSALPLWVHLEYTERGPGQQPYYSLRPPQTLIERATPNREAEPTAPRRDDPIVPTDELEDLPF